MNWKNILINTLALFLGILIGATINMLIITYGESLIPYPEGYDATTIESINKGIHLLEPKHFIIPFVAHALGTLVGAFLAAFISPDYKLRFSLAVGVLFLLGGISMVFEIQNSPMWFNALDVILAYIPMGYLGYQIATKLKK